MLFQVAGHAHSQWVSMYHGVCVCMYVCMYICMYAYSYILMLAHPLGVSVSQAGSHSGCICTWVYQYVCIGKLTSVQRNESAASCPRLSAPCKSLGTRDSDSWHAASIPVPCYFCSDATPFRQVPALCTLDVAVCARLVFYVATCSRNSNHRSHLVYSSFWHLWSQNILDHVFAAKESAQNLTWVPSQCSSCYSKGLQAIWNMVKSPGWAAVAAMGIQIRFCVWCAMSYLHWVFPESERRVVENLEKQTPTLLLSLCLDSTHVQLLWIFSSSRSSRWKSRFAAWPLSSQSNVQVLGPKWLIGCLSSALSSD